MIDWFECLIHFFLGQNGCHVLSPKMGVRDREKKFWSPEVLLGIYVDIYENVLNCILKLLSSALSVSDLVSHNKICSCIKKIRSVSRFRLRTWALFSMYEYMKIGYCYSKSLFLNFIPVMVMVIFSSLKVLLFLTYFNSPFFSAGIEKEISNFWYYPLIGQWNGILPFIEMLLVVSF